MMVGSAGTELAQEWRQPLPRTGIMPLRNVIHWLAFGSDWDVLEQIGAAFERRDAAPYLWTGQFIWTPALQILSAIESGEEPPDPHEEPNLAVLHARLQSKMQQEGMSLPALRKELEAFVNGAETLLLALDTAKSVLWDMLATGRITMRATKAGATAQRIEPEFFGTPGASMTMDGDLLIRDQMQYQAAYFLTSEISLLLEPSISTATPRAAVLAQADLGGAPPKYDRDGFIREVVRACFKGEILNRRELKKHMLDWCSQHWPADRQPSEEWVRTVLKAVASGIDN